MGFFGLDPVTNFCQWLSSSPLQLGHDPCRLPCPSWRCNEGSLFNERSRKAVDVYACVVISFMCIIYVYPNADPCLYTCHAFRMLYVQLTSISKSSRLLVSTPAPPRHQIHKYKPASNQDAPIKTTPPLDALDAFESSLGTARTALGG